MSATVSLPAGWTTERPKSGAYKKYVKRDAVEVPKRYAGEPFHRDAVIIVTHDRAGIATGPGARNTWRADDPEALAQALANVVEDWIQNGGDPYGGKALREQLHEVAADSGGELV